MKKVLLALDSYKDCMSSFEVESVAAAVFHRTCPAVKVLCVPMADGGEGIMDVLVRQTGGQKISVEVHDALMRPLMAEYGVLGDGTTAVVEMAQASGLPRLSFAERNPMLTTTYGTGELVRAALSAGFRRLLIGLGGSATNDGGMGMLQALGARFFTADHQELGIGCGKLLGEVAKIELDDFYTTIAGASFLTACDVDNPYCGPNGAAAIFGPQKGATLKMVEELDQGLEHFSTVVEAVTGIAIKAVPGAGAAGGLGGGMFAFFQSELLPGVDLILAQTGFRKQVEGAALLITGEGKSDHQTLMGKVPSGVLKVGLEQGVDVVLMSGAIEEKDVLLSAGFSWVEAVTPIGQPLEVALQPAVATANLQQTLERILVWARAKGIL